MRNDAAWRRARYVQALLNFNPMISPWEANGVSVMTNALWAVESLSASATAVTLRHRQHTAAGFRAAMIIHGHPETRFNTKVEEDRNFTPRSHIGRAQREEERIMKRRQKQSRSHADFPGRERFTDEDVRQSRPVTATAEPPSRGWVAYADVKSSLSKRLTAECFDRVVPVFVFPVIIAVPMLLIGKEYFVLIWFFVLFAWHLLRDSSPNRRSLGKKLRKLRVVMANGQDKCGWWRLIVRRSGSAVSQLFYAMALAIHFPSVDMSQSAIGVSRRIFSLFGADCQRSRIMLCRA